MTAHLTVITLPVLQRTISIIWRLFWSAGHQKVIRLSFQQRHSLTRSLYRNFTRHRLGVAAGEGKSAEKSSPQNQQAGLVLILRPARRSEIEVRAWQSVNSHPKCTNHRRLNEAAVAFSWNNPKKRLTHIWTRRKLRRSLRFQT
jgi:hypothetical protein